MICSAMLQKSMPQKLPLRVFTKIPISFRRCQGRLMGPGQNTLGGLLMGFLVQVTRWH